MKTRFLLLALALILLAGCGAKSTPTPYPTYTPQPTYTALPTLAPSPTDTPKPTPTLVPLYPPPALQYLLLPADLPLKFDVPSPPEKYEGEVPLDQFIEGSGYHEQFSIPRAGLEAVAVRIQTAQTSEGTFLEFRQHVAVFDSIDSAREAFLVLSLDYTPRLNPERPFSSEEMPTDLGDEFHARCGPHFFSGETCLAIVRVSNILCFASLNGPDNLPSPVTKIVFGKLGSRIRETR